MDDTVKAKFIDGLKRAQEMEEAMGGVLIELCRPNLATTEIPRAILQEIKQELLKIQADTARHKLVVTALLNDNEGIAGER